MDAQQVDDLFLRGIWAAAIPDTADTAWVDRVAALPNSDEPNGDYGLLVQRMLDAGLSRHEIARFAQIVGYETAFTISYLLDDPSASTEGLEDDKDLGDFGWGLFETDPTTDEPTRRMGSLHESLLGLDPSGREMRPVEGN